MAWTRIDHRHRHSYEQSLGNRRVEVVKCYDGQWALFAYIDGVMVRTRVPRRYVTFNEARKQGRQFLTHHLHNV